jgi:hypothetical protein
MPLPATTINPTEIAINSPYVRSTMESTRFGFTLHPGRSRLDWIEQLQTQ